MMRKGKDIQNIRVFAKTTRACNSINKETLAQVFFCEFGEISKNTFLHRTSLVTNFCLCVAKKKKKGYYRSLNENNVTVSKNFWKTLKPMLSYKSAVAKKSS